MRKKLFTFLLALAASVGLSWATVITWDASKVSSMAMIVESGSNSKTSDGITVTAVSTGEFVEFGDHGGAIEIGNGEGSGGGYITFESSVGNITRIDINHWDTGRWSNANEGWPSPYYQEFDGGTFTWSGTPAASVTLTGDAPRYIWGITSIVFTIEDGGGSAQSGLQVTEFTVPASWQNDQTPVTASDLPGFVAYSFEEAGAWTAPTEGTVKLLYTFDDGVKATYFINGVWGEEYVAGFGRGLLYSWASYGERIFYTSDGSTPAVDPEPTSAEPTIVITTNKSQSSYTQGNITITCSKPGDSDGFYLQESDNGTATITNSGSSIISQIELEIGWFPQNRTYVRANGAEPTSSDEYSITFSNVNSNNVTLTITDEKIQIRNVTITLADEGGSTPAVDPTPTPSGDGDKLPGAFSVGGDKVVYFSKANLQATTADNGSTWTWGFAENQWDYVGNNTANNAINGGGTVSSNGPVDLFAWSSTDNNYFGINNSINEADYSGDFKDWGAKKGSDWRTLTINEWQYLLEERNPGSSSANYTNYPRYTNAQILTDGTAPQKDIKGIILFPDDFNDGGESIDGVTWGSINPSFFSSYPTTCTTAGWATLESMGCVFLPSAGSRQNFGDEFAIVDVAIMGNYWSSTLNSGEPEDPQSIVVGGSTLGIGTNPRYFGLSVRLVSETAPSGGSTPTSSETTVTWDLSDMASMGTQGGYFKAKGITLMAYGVDNGMTGDGMYGGAYFGGPFVFTTSLGKFTKIEVTNSYLYEQPAFSGDGWTLDGTNAVWEGTPAALVSLVSNFGGITQIKFTIDPNTSTPANSCGDGLTWAVNDGVLTISYDGVGTGSMDNYDDPLSMPWYGQNITSVVLPEGLISIGQNAFAFINTFSQITLPSTLQYILMNAFSGCGLTSVTIPENVKGIGVSAFISSSSLATVTFEPTTPPRVGGNAFEYCHNDLIINYPCESRALYYKDMQADIAYYRDKMYKCPAPPSNLHVTELEPPASWSGKSTYLAVADMPGFEETDADLAETWEAPKDCNSVLIYHVVDQYGDDRMYYHYFYAGDFVESQDGLFPLGTVYSNATNYGIKTFYTSSGGGSTPAVDSEVQDVIDLIDAIGSVTYTQACKDKIDAARDAYDALNADQKALVSNYSTLTDAEDAYAALIPVVTNYSISLDGITENADKVTLNNASAAEGETITVTPAEGYQITSFTASYASAYSVRVTADPSVDVYEATPYVGALPKEFTENVTPGLNGATFHSIEGDDPFTPVPASVLEYVGMNAAKDQMTIRVNDVFSGIIRVYYTYNVETCEWDDYSQQEICMGGTAQASVRVVCEAAGGVAPASKDDVTGAYSFTMPAGNVTITATVEAIPAPSYIDADFAIDFRTDPYEVVGGGSLPAGVAVEGTFNDTQHGYRLPVVTIPVTAGNYLVKMGTCQFSNQNGAIKNEDGSVTYATLATNTGVCYDANPAKNYVAAIITIPSDQIIKVYGAEYTPYFSIAKMPEIPDFTDFEINFRTDPYDMISGAKPEGTVIIGTYHDNLHGYQNVEAVVPVEAGNYRLTVGACQYGTPGNVMSETNAELASFNSNLGEGNCYHNNTAANIVSTIFTVDMDQTITINGGAYMPYMKLEKLQDNTYYINFENAEGAIGIVPGEIAITAGESWTIPANLTLYKEGYTFAGWSDGVNTYAPGDEFFPSAHGTLQAVYTANSVSIADASTINVKWYFGESNGAPSVTWNGAAGYLLAKGEVDGELIDLKLDIDATSGKFQNSGRGDQWAQVNANTVFTFPSKEGAVVNVETYSGNETYVLGDGTLTCNTNDYYSYLEITYPAAPIAAEIGDPNNTAEVETFLTTYDGQTVDELSIVRPVYRNTYYNTLCLPFDMNAAQIAASSIAGAEIKEFTGAEVVGDELLIDLAPVDEIEAGKPYFIKYSSADALTQLDFTNVTIDATAPQGVTFNGVTLRGTFVPFQMEAQSNLNYEGGYLFLGQNNQLFWPGVTNSIKPFRAYFYVDTTPSNQNGAPKRYGMPARFNEEQVATSIGNVQGDKVQSTKVLRDGQLIIIRNGVEYNANGMMVK